MTVTLQPITRENFRQVARLKVAEHQQDWVAPNLYSIAESKFEPQMTIKAISADDTLVGFAFYGPADWGEGDVRQTIMRLMIADGHQGKGYGRAALRLIIDDIRANMGAADSDIYISYVPGNDSAEKLYLSLGFINEGEIVDDEIVLRLPKQAQP